MLLHGSFCLLTLTILIACLRAEAYIPALPTNDTNKAIKGGLNMTDVSKLYLQWYSNGSYSENVSYQLVGNNSQGISKGALVHFSETKALNETTTTPWIALVACDTNGTNFSMEDDIFTLARDRGAVAALLFSSYSMACIINPEYADPNTFDQVMDIFSTQSLTSANLILYQFGQSGVNASIYAYYDAQRLNDSAQSINDTIASKTPVAPGYLFATLKAYNATDNGDGDDGDNDTGNSRPSSGNSSNTGLAMIILYAITGCVSALFCIVIISGAIRAIRHPERYGPRAADRRGGFGGMGQSRARGITRAILDTFPVVKFGNSNGVDDNGLQRAIKDVESPTTEMEMPHWEVLDSANMDVQVRPVSTVTRHSQDSGNHSEKGQERASSSAAPVDAPESPHPDDVTSGRGPSIDGPSEEVVPAAIGRETCPICIVDFEEGDDLRVLPCEGNHRFHQTCVDPWLLELSSSCPICRQDFQALETILSGGSEDGHRRGSFIPSTPLISGSPQSNRFSKYLRFARRRRHGHAEGHSPADNPVPVFSNSSA